MTLQKIKNCLKQAEQIEKAVSDLILSSGEGARLSKLLRTAKEALLEAEKIVQQWS